MGAFAQHQGKSAEVCAYFIEFGVYPFHPLFVDLGTILGQLTAANAIVFHKRDRGP